MNSALVSLLMNYMSDYDRKKNREEDWKHQEKVREEERAQSAADKLSDIKYKEREEATRAEYSANNPIRTNSISDIQNGAPLFQPNTVEDYRYRPAIAQFKDEQNMRFAAQPVEEQIKYVRDFERARPVIAKFAPQMGMTTDEAYLAVGKNPELVNIMQNQTALEGMKAGVPASSAASAISRDKAAQAKDENTIIAETAMRPNLAKEAVGAQNMRMATQRFGGQTPSQALTDKQGVYTVINDDGTISLVENPYKDKLSEKPDILGQFGEKGQLKTIADSLGMEKYPMNFDTTGRPVARPTHSVIAPMTSTGATFNNNTSQPTSWDLFQQAAKQTLDTQNEAAKQGRTVNEQQQINATRQSLFQKMVEDYKKRQSQPQQSLVWPQ